MPTNVKAAQFIVQEKNKTISDATTSISFIADSLTQNGLDDFANMLLDVSQVYYSVSSHSSEGSDINQEEYSNILYSFLVLKYVNKITLDKYRNKITQELVKTLQS